jgi:glucose-6-phosphate-specific signal transduction histidine kinase
VQEIIIFAAIAALAGVVLGAISGVWFADRRLRRHYEEVRVEIVRLRALAEDKLSGDDPNLDTLLNNIHTAVEGAYRAIEAMETQAAITKRKSDGGKEVISSSRQIIRMIDELSGGTSEHFDIAPKPAPKIAVKQPLKPAKQAPKLTAHPLALERQEAVAKK